MAQITQPRTDLHLLQPALSEKKFLKIFWLAKLNTTIFPTTRRVVGATGATTNHPTQTDLHLPQQVLAIKKFFWENFLVGWKISLNNKFSDVVVFGTQKHNKPSTWELETRKTWGWGWLGVLAKSGLKFTEPPNHELISTCLSRQKKTSMGKFSGWRKN